MQFCQKDINNKMRAILIDWLVSVHFKFELRERTLFLAVSILDRYLEKTPIARQSLQLVGVACLLIASKIEEIYYPDVMEFSNITDLAYSPKEIITMEGQILLILDFELHESCTLDFIDPLLRNFAPEARINDFVVYILELSLMEYDTLRFSAIERTVAAIVVANRLFKWQKEPVLVEILMKKGKVSPERIGSCVKQMTLIVDASKKTTLKAVQKKHQRLLSELAYKFQK